MANFLYGRRFRKLATIASVLLFAVYLSDAVLAFLGHSSRFKSWYSGTPPRRPRDYIQATFLGAHPTATRAIPAHEFRDDGLLVVNPNAPHPIFELIDRAEKRWDAKKKRASETLVQAVAEYKRRYHRNPPKGFDEWWKYVQKNNVQLPDEYDFIWKDLEPFWGISPTDLREFQEKQEDENDTYTLARDKTGSIHIAKRSFPEAELEKRNLLRGSQDLMELLKDVEQHIPPFRAVFSPHDNPNLLSDYVLKRMALQAAAANIHLDMKHLPIIRDRGYLSACAPSSPARRGPPLNQFKRPQHLKEERQKTFIHDHPSAMDMCLHPDLFYHHSQFIPHGAGPAPRRVIAPQFAYCSTILHHDIQPPTFISWTNAVDHIPWKDKVDERLMWRGSNTGMNHDENQLWREAQRPQLVKWGSRLEGNVTVLMSSDTSRESITPVGKGVQIPLNRLSPAAVDIAFAGQPIACGGNYCNVLGKEFEYRRQQGLGSDEASRYRYVVDVDGNGWSSRFKRLITSEALVFKATIYPEWYLDRIEPWVHYVPVQVDLSDLYDAFLFFRGGLNGEGRHEEMAHKIALAGSKWSQAFWRQEDMTAYMFRLMLEYARVMRPDRDSAAASFILPEADQT